MSKSTNKRVYQDLAYRNALLLKILTSVPAPLSPVPLYLSSLSLLCTALHYLNSWNRPPNKFQGKYLTLTEHSLSVCVTVTDSNVVRF